MDIHNGETGRCEHCNCQCHGWYQKKWKHKNMHHHSSLGGLWFIGWLFTIGYLHLTFLQGLLALIIWPYDLGVYLSTLIH